MTAQRRSMLHRVLLAAADDLARQHGVPVAQRHAFVAAAVVLHEQHLVRALGGERVEIPRQGSAQREMRRLRIVDSLRRGEEPAAVARREGVSTRWVRALRGTLAPCTLPPGAATVAAAGGVSED